MPHLHVPAACSEEDGTLSAVVQTKKVKSVVLIPTGASTSPDPVIFGVVQAAQFIGTIIARTLSQKLWNVATKTAAIAMSTQLTL